MSTETDKNTFDGLLPSGSNTLDQQAACIELIKAQRERSPQISESLDRFLVERYAELETRCAALKSDFEEVVTIQAEFRKELEKFTDPPWIRGVFFRCVDTNAGLLAEVFYGGNRQLLRLGQGIGAEDLATGQVVYLDHEKRAVLGVASDDLLEAGEIASVEQVLGDGRLVLRDRDVQVLVHPAKRVHDAHIKSGENVRWSRELMLAFEPVQSSASSELFVTEYLSEQPAQHLGGLTSEVDQAISLFTQGIAQPEVAARYGLTQGNTLLMHGPPGNGKTSIARSIGSALAAATGEQCRFASIKGAQLESPWVGTTQANVRELFRELSRDERPTLLFIDEVDSIGRTRGGAGGHHNDKFLSSYLTELDGLVLRSGSLGIIAATNRKDLIDQALLERISGTELYIGRPGQEAACEIFRIHLPPTLPYGPNGAEAVHTRDDIIEAAVGTFYSPNADNAIAELRFRDGTRRTVTACQMLSGRVIEQICLQARRSAFRRHSEGGIHGIRVEDMEEAVADALNRLASTLSTDNVRAMLNDLPQDLDVVAVEPVYRTGMVHRYLHRARQGR